MTCSAMQYRSIYSYPLYFALTRYLHPLQTFNCSLGLTFYQSLNLPKTFLSIPFSENLTRCSNHRTLCDLIMPMIDRFSYISLFFESSISPMDHQSFCLHISSSAFYSPALFVVGGSFD